MFSLLCIFLVIVITQDSHGKSFEIRAINETELQETPDKCKGYPNDNKDLPELEVIAGEGSYPDLSLLFCLGCLNYMEGCAVFQEEKDDTVTWGCASANSTTEEGILVGEEWKDCDERMFEMFVKFGWGYL